MLDRFGLNELVREKLEIDSKLHDYMRDLSVLGATEEGLKGAMRKAAVCKHLRGAALSGGRAP